MDTSSLVTMSLTEEWESYTQEVWPVRAKPRPCCNWIRAIKYPGYDVKLIRCCPKYNVKLIWRQQRMIFCE